MKEQYFTESLIKGYGQQFTIEKIIYEKKTDHQHLIIFDNAFFGRVLALDGIIQTTQKDEFIYHEMLTHVPLVAHGQARSVLIIGGGDGGALREVLRHTNIEQVTQVEIDADVIELSKRYLPQHSNGAFDDPRTHLVIDDGLHYLTQTKARYDVIMADTSDPVGPNKSLFSKSFYHACQQALNPGGILTAQNGVSFFQLKEFQDTASRLHPIFADHYFYRVAVPTYTGGIMSLAWASDDPSLRRIDLPTLKRRFSSLNISTRYYTPAMHHSAFALPQYLIDHLSC